MWTIGPVDLSGPSKLKIVLGIDFNIHRKNILEVILTHVIGITTLGIV